MQPLIGHKTVKISQPLNCDLHVVHQGHP
jgi:hypothetical protein